MILCAKGEEGAQEFGVCQVFGNSKFMALRSALDDFETRTLAAIPGKLAKLHYLGQLHDGHGGYAHWGMGRVYGEETARRAIRNAHQELITDILRTPLGHLAEDLQMSATTAQLSSEELIGSLQRLTPRTWPEHSLTTAAQKHFKVVLHALATLAASQALATPRGASPPRPLGR